ncbi:MAG: hypothetical protein A07HR67_02487 [uncultured archaeon A07HR67]|nr:MAG: hypothetical protein A07HR67_02487 [uncultured archaeon A07HR67]
MEHALTNWLLGLIAALLAVLVLDATGREFLDAVVPIEAVANLLALVTFLAFVLLTGAFMVYTASFREA